MEQIATGFQHPIDAVLRENKLYVLELVFGGTGTLWELTFPADSGTDVDDAERLRSADIAVRIASVYPNPTSEKLRVEIVTSVPTTTVTVDVVDVLGRRTRVLPATQVNGGVYKPVIDVRGLAAGTYFVRVSSSEGVSSTSRASFAITR